MRILTLNQKMFNLQFDDSLNEFLKEYEPDVAIIQECRPNKIVDVYKNPITPNKFGNEKEIDARNVITVSFCKDNIWNRIDSEKLGKYNRCYVAIETTQNVNKAFSVLGIHIPAETDKNKEDLKNFISEIKKSEFDIICGDFNASFRKSESINYTMLKELTQSKYSNLWEKGLKEEKAYYKDYKGTEHNINEKKASKNIRTFVGNTHIDYILGKEIALTKITIDMRTLAFTDHCAIIIDCEKASKSK